MMRYQSYFTVHRRDTTPTARQYLDGSLACEKGQANMERMEEEGEGSAYRRYQHFVSNSPWDHGPVMEQVTRETSERFQARRTRHGTPTGYIVDESAHLKQGMESVGVSRQYAGGWRKLLPVR